MAKKTLSERWAEAPTSGKISYTICVVCVACIAVYLWYLGVKWMLSWT